MEEATIFYAFALGKEDLSDFFEHLAMNGYTYDVTFRDNGYKTLYVYSEEADYVMQMMRERDIDFDIM